MRAVIGGLAVPAFIFFVSVGAMATTVVDSTYDDGAHITYTYSLTCDEGGDIITAFHVYAPVNLGTVTGWCDNPAWSFNQFFDEEINACDIYWEVDTGQSDGLSTDESIDFLMQTSSSVPIDHEFVLDGYLGNWGIDTVWWAGWGTFVMMPCVAVPHEVTGIVPEPGSLIGVLSGMGMFAVLRRRK